VLYFVAGESVTQKTHGPFSSWTSTNTRKVSGCCDPPGHFLPTTCRDLPEAPIPHSFPRQAWKTFIKQLNVHDEPRQTTPKPAPQGETGRRSKWAPGSWATAAEYNRNKPEVRSPVIVGGSSVIRTPEQLQDLCQLPTVPSLTETTETSLSLFPEEKEGEESHDGKKTLYIVDVSLRQ
jgi:hypothetical protein